MKNVLRFCLLCCLTGALAACSKNNSSTSGDYTLKASTDSVLSVTLVKNQQFLCNLGGFAIEDGAGILTQAQHYSFSVAYRDTTGRSPNIYYRYAPTPGYSGSDQVTLETLTGSFGSNYHPYINHFFIRFTILP